MTSLNYTSKDLELLPDDGKRYEIIDGELYMSKQPHWHHQFAGLRISMFLQMWSDQTKAGIANYAPGLIFDDDEDVVPDIVWISRQRLATALRPDGKLHEAPELAVEILSPGSTNERRDRELKLKLYSRRGSDEYWIVNWREQRVEVYRRQNAVLTLQETLNEDDLLHSPLLPGFSCHVRQLFVGGTKP